MTAEAGTGRIQGIDPSGVDEPGQRVDRALVNEAFTRLHPEYRDAIHKAHTLRWTTGQIAADLNVPEAVVKYRLHHALRTLRHTLGNPAAR